jgi:RNA polymerase sigma-70 factor, ECF subfamily
MGAMPSAGNAASPAYSASVEPYAFVPRVFAAQQALPKAIQAEQRLIEAIAAQEGGLSRRHKDRLFWTVASVWGHDCRRVTGPDTSCDETRNDSALVAFAQKLARYALLVSKHDVEDLKRAGFDDREILEAVQTIALGQMLCTLANALCPDDERQPASEMAPAPFSLAANVEYTETPGPYLQTKAVTGYPIYPLFRQQFGFVPNIFVDQMLRPDVVEAEAEVLQQILIGEDRLSRIQKENILLAISAANANTYFVAVHGQILTVLGVPAEDSDQVVQGEYPPIMPAADVALLKEIRKLALPAAASPGKFDSGELQAQGLTQLQIVEAATMAALTNFLNTLQFGLGAVPDFPPHRIFTPKDLHRSAAPSRLTVHESQSEDADTPYVARVQNGDTDAFEELVRRYSRRVFSTLAGILGGVDDARDATQEVFLKVFEHIGNFQGRSKFSTWLISIAINTGTDLLRQRKPYEPLDEIADDEGFRPKQIQSWTENPEQLLAASERNDLVREAVLRLPPKYRVAVLLRDINQLSTEEAAAALGLSIPALKARLLRGRLMLRESLAPHFIRTENRSFNAQLR